MTMAAVLTVTVSLGLVGAALYIKQGAAQASANWEAETQVTVWILPHATPAELLTVESQLHTSPYVNNCHFWSKRKDCKEARRITGQSDLLAHPGVGDARLRCGAPRTTGAMRPTS